MSVEDKPQDTADDIAQEAREEERLQQSMAKLEEMHIRLRQLRDTVPSLIRPFHGINSPPEAVYAEFSKAAHGAVNNTKDFVALMKSRSSQDVLLEARKSRANNSDDITGWLAEQHEDWFDKPFPSESQKDTGLSLEEGESTQSKSTLEEVVQNFEKSHPDAKLVIVGEHREIQYTLPGPAELLFRIQESQSPTGNGTTVYLVGCETSRHVSWQGDLSSTITTALSQRPRQTDLEYTLQHLSTYFDVMSRSCSKCGHLIDSNGYLPVVRQRIIADDGTAQSRALHFGCV